METIELDLKAHDYPTYGDMKSVTHNAKQYSDKLQELFPYEKITLVCRGTSGLTIASVMATLLPNVQINYLRKDSEISSSHCGTRSNIWSGAIEGTRLVVVDDFISTGSTLREIEGALKGEYGDLYKDIDCLCVQNRPWKIKRHLDDIAEPIFKDRKYQLICQD